VKLTSSTFLRLLEVRSLDALCHILVFNLPMNQLTGTINKKQSGKNEQVLDKLKVERDRGITGEYSTFIIIFASNH
jgi:translation elongation factor EF-4